MAGSFATAIVDVDLGALEHRPAMLAKLSCLARLPNLYVVSAEAADRLTAQANRLGAQDVLVRPFSSDELASRLARIETQRARPASSDPGAEHLHQPRPPQAYEDNDGIAQASRVLARVFRQVQTGEAPRFAPFHDASHAFVGALAEAAQSAAGMREWLAAIQSHHSATFRHSLTVTANAVLFGLHLRLRQADLERLAMAGLLHDIGKAVVPLAILDKPARLDPDEFALVQRHPETGRDLIERSPDAVDPELVDAVVHHHEYLDGSGYPHGLKAEHLSDLVRIVTIADVFTALVEDRAYKAGLSPPAALAILDEMAGKGKLDAVLVQQFKAMIECSRA
ncbi:HD domain-containing phosphohydrolase [Salinarimonas soli]|uniref:HD domain-containing phosphohydrolase n=1 Tax=Salinarimonas soli TaxID=1638099 RepID=UPI001661F0DF|nr:HD domain-containing phosphohydrolase [Salinarimonas soli]